MVLASPAVSVNKGTYELCRHDTLRLTKGGIMLNDTLFDQVAKLHSARNQKSAIRTEGSRIPQGGNSTPRHDQGISGRKAMSQTPY